MERFRRMLLARQAELRSSQDDAADEARPVELDQNAVGRVSRMDAMQVQQMALEAARRRERQLAGVAQALARIDAGAYGDCVGCDEPIDPRRLAIDPTALRCIHCAEAAAR